MTHTILVEHEGAGYKATPLGLPDVVVVAPTRGEAVRGITEALSSRLAGAEVVQVEVPVGTPNPLEAAFGLFADDPDLVRQICAEAYAARDA